MWLLFVSSAKPGPSHTLDSPGPRTRGMRSWMGATLALGSVVTMEKQPSCWTAARRNARAPGRRKRYWRRTGLPVFSLTTFSVELDS